jgi:hypothetical protein
VTRIARLLKNNTVGVTGGLETDQARFFLEARTFKFVGSIKANPVKAGDAKPRVFRHASRGYDSLVAENNLFQRMLPAAITLAAPTRANDQVLLSRIDRKAPISHLARVFV